MNLFELSKMDNNWQVITNCEFNILGMPTSKFVGKKVLCFLNDVKYLSPILENKDVTGFICNKETFNNIDLTRDIGVMLVKEPKIDFFRINNELGKKDFYWKRFSNEISNTSKIAKYAIIGDNSIKIGDNCIIEDNVVIHPGTIIGNNVIIRSGSQVGSSGFQFFDDGDIVYSLETAGRLIIKDYVEIQHNCCLDRGILGGDTIINEYVKIDNFIHIAHDDNIGERTRIAAGAQIGGRVVIGKGCWIGVNATISNGLNIGDNSRVSLGAVVTKDVKSNTIVSGNFAIEHDKFIDFIKSIR